MRLVIAGTGPINYLLLIGHIDILPALFEKVILPSAVRDELTDPDTPALVRNWIADPPPWLEVHQTSGPDAVANLGAGETAAITLAVELKADLLLMDERRGVRAARRHGLEVTGTLGVLSRAGQRGIVDLAEAFDRIRQTTFRYRQEIPAGNNGSVSRRDVRRPVKTAATYLSRLPPAPPVSRRSGACGCSLS